MTATSSVPVVIAGWIDYEPGERQQVLKQFGEVARISRQEPGCLDYAVTPDLDDERRIRVFEHWESDAALWEHLTMPHVLEFRTATKAFHRLGRSLSKHLVASSEPMQSSSST